MTPKPTPTFAFVNGLRGLAALYVLIFHCWLIPHWNPATTHWSPSLTIGTSWMHFGIYAVDVFIVLSGFCLMLPVLHAPDKTVRGGFSVYLKRRARRILPAYYAALLISLLLIAAIPGLHAAKGDWWDHTLPAFGTRNILLHLLLLHNFSPRTLWQIHGGFWSLAVEWQIYFIFPLVLLPVWRKTNIWASIATAFALAFALHKFCPSSDFSRPWLLGLFALGMGAAALCQQRPSQGRQAVLISVAVALGAICLHFGNPDANRMGGFHETLMGVATCCVILYLAGQTQMNQQGILRRLLEHPATMWLGTISYSLYIAQLWPLGILNLCVRYWHIASVPTFWLMILGGIPLTLLVSYGFHLVFERPFMSGQTQTVRKTEQAAILASAA